MKLTGVVRGIPTLSSTLLKPKPICCCSTTTTTTAAPKPKTPLFLKPPRHSATLNDLRRWHAWAHDLASSVGSTFTHSDNGPDSALLKRELRWLLEDALEDPSAASRLLAGNGSVEVPLRARLDELYEMWRERIEERRPFQYLVGCGHWRDLVLCVEEGVLIPRPETELVVDLLEDVVGGGGLGNDGVWADLGTGSGALAIGIARILGAEGRVVATDVSPVAVRVASFNVQRYGLQEKIEVREGSWFEPLKDFEGKLAGLVSNPPYIPSGDIPGLQAEVGRHEPLLALDGGSTGMDCLHHLVSGVGTMLKPGGFFAFETNGEKQCSFLAHYLSNKNSFCDVKIVPDYAGIQRFLTGFHCRGV